jgi:hypothetical protein
MQNQIAFIESLQDSTKSFIHAIFAEESSNFDDYEATLERKYEEGFIDGMRHAWLLLGGGVDEIGLLTSDEIEKQVRALVKHNASRAEIEFEILSQ